eukprot:jgi/Tetstr1/432340/TSEL_021737.t1
MLRAQSHAVEVGSPDNGHSLEPPHVQAGEGMIDSGEEAESDSDDQSDSLSGADTGEEEDRDAGRIRPDEMDFMRLPARLRAQQEEHELSDGMSDSDEEPAPELLDLARLPELPDLPELPPERPALRPGAGAWQRLHNAHRFNLIFNLGARAARHVNRTNTDMVDALKENGSLFSEPVIRAFLAVPRGAFVPAEYADEAYIDSPLRLEEFEFNLSAPHMHAMSLEALELQAGQRILDIGCGSGIVSALAALLVGCSGSVVGIDVLPDAVHLSESNLARLTADSKAFAAASASCTFHQHNAFLPLANTFDRIYVGAACPEHRVAALAKLLSPDGKMIVPVGSELRLVSRSPEAPEGQRPQFAHKVLSQVRFGDLVVPSDARIVLETIKFECEQQCSVPLLRSTLGDDMVEASAASGSSAASAQSAWESGGNGVGEADLGPHDCALRCTVAGWRLPAHRAMLKVRCRHFRAYFDSGMRDADAEEFEVPDNFAKETIEAFLHYVYHDALMPGLSGPEVAQLVHAATFFSAQRLVSLCEAALAAEMHAEGDGAAADLAPQLLMLADDVNLPHLRNVALHYITHNYAAAAASPHFAQLSQPQMAIVAQAACERYMRTLSALKEVAGPCQDGLDISGKTGGAFSFPL